MYVFSLWVQVFRRPVEEEALEGVFREKHIKTALYCVERFGVCIWGELRGQIVTVNWKECCMT